MSKIVRPAQPGEAERGPTIRYQQGKIKKLSPQKMNKRTKAMYDKLKQKQSG
jgi:hypothetical protein